MPMRRDFSFLLLGLAFLCASAGAEPRPALRGASSVRVANYGAPSVLLEGQKARAVVEELNALRRKDWKRGDAKISCYSTVVLLSGKKRVGEFRVTFENMVERPVEKGQAIYGLAISEADIATLARLLREIAPSKDCK